jgi:hypothetical protein
MINVKIYLGRPIDKFMTDVPCRDWPFEEKVEINSRETRLYFIYTKNHIEFLCDRYRIVNTIFLTRPEKYCSHEALFSLPFSASREHARQLLGTPTKTGLPIIDKILGTYGHWDLFCNQESSVHVEYDDGLLVKRITLSVN